MKDKHFLLLLLFCNALLNAIFIIFRLFDVVNWSWLVVFLPMAVNIMIFMSSLTRFLLHTGSEASVAHPKMFYPVRKTA